MRLRSAIVPAASSEPSAARPTPYGSRATSIDATRWNWSSISFELSSGGVDRWPVGPASRIVRTLTIIPPWHLRSIAPETEMSLTRSDTADMNRRRLRSHPAGYEQARKRCSSKTSAVRLGTWVKTLISASQRRLGADATIRRGRPGRLFRSLSGVS